MNKEIKELEKQKDFAYYERNQLVALLSKVFPSSIGIHEGDDWEIDWRHIIYVNFPSGQASWHIHDSELKHFTHLTVNPFIKWDGHSTEEKYRRVSAIKQMAKKTFSYKPSDYEGYIENPKTKASGVYGAIPHTGRCPQNCKDCFFQSGRSFLEPLEENLPNMPNPLRMMDKIVRVNDGHDSSVDKEMVMEKCAVYRNKFYNTSFPAMLGSFDAPVVLTVNPSDMTDSEYHKLDKIPDTLMYVRVRVNMWNIQLVDEVVKYYSEHDIPIILTFMAYYTESIPDDYKDMYEFKKRTLNSYWVPTEAAWKFVEDRYHRNKWVYSCGSYGETKCEFCGNCLREYYRTTERMERNNV